MVAVLALAAVFAATLKLTVPLPVPLGVTTVSQPASLTAVHAHPPLDVSVIDPLPAASEKLWLAGERA
jgi:hypothetical protein